MTAYQWTVAGCLAVVDNRADGFRYTHMVTNNDIFITKQRVKIVIRSLALTQPFNSRAVPFLLTAKVFLNILNLQVDRLTRRAPLLQQRLKVAFRFKYFPTRTVARQADSARKEAIQRRSGRTTLTLIDTG